MFEVDEVISTESIVVDGIEPKKVLAPEYVVAVVWSNDKP